MTGPTPVPDDAPSLAGMAHEYNNLLTVISGSLALAERHAVGNPALIRLIDNMRTAADRAERLTQRLTGLAGLPSSPPQQHLRPAPRQMEGAQPRPPQCVLVVEDDPNVAAVAVAVIESLGLNFELAENGQTALECLQAREIDLVFSDIVMPGGMSGIELARAIETSHPKVPVLLATGFSREALSAGALRYPVLPKPYSVDELSRRVRQMLGGR